MIGLHLSPVSAFWSALATESCSPSKLAPDQRSGVVCCAAVETFPEAVFNVRGTTVKARLNRLGLELTAVKAFVVSCVGRDVLGLCKSRNSTLCLFD